MDKIFTKVSGVTFEGRQAVVSKLRSGDGLMLCREKDNKFDPNAIQIVSQFYGQVGYINKVLARELAEAMDKGINYKTKVLQVTGSADQSYGVNIEIVRIE